MYTQPLFVHWERTTLTGYKNEGALPKGTRLESCFENLLVPWDYLNLMVLIGGFEMFDYNKDGTV